MTISASQVPPPVAVAVKGALGVIPRRTPLTSPGTLDRLSGQATGRTGMRPGTGHNNGPLAQVTVARRFGGRQSFQDFYPPGCVVVLVGRYFYHNSRQIGALLSDRSGLAMIRAAP